MAKFNDDYLVMLEARLAKARKDYEVEKAVAQQCPEVEGLEISQIMNFRTPWVSYKIKDPADWLKLLDAYGTLETVHAIRHGCYSISPLRDQEAAYRLRGKYIWQIPQAVRLEISAMTHRSTVLMQICPISPAIILRAEYEGAPYQWTGSFTSHYDMYGRATSGKLHPPTHPFYKTAEKSERFSGTNESGSIKYFWRASDFKMILKKVLTSTD